MGWRPRLYEKTARYLAAGYLLALATLTHGADTIRLPLGQRAERFPKRFSVYLHDTPSQQLFDKSPRAFSSGCAQIARRLASGRTQEFAITRRLPIVLAYWTAEVNADGELILRNDLYARDQRLLAALQQAGR